MADATWLVEFVGGPRDGEQIAFSLKPSAGRKSDGRGSFWQPRVDELTGELLAWPLIQHGRKFWLVKWDYAGRVAVP